MQGDRCKSRTGGQSPVSSFPNNNGDQREIHLEESEKYVCKTQGNIICLLVQGDSCNSRAGGQSASFLNNKPLTRRIREIQFNESKKYVGEKQGNSINSHPFSTATSYKWPGWRSNQPDVFLCRETRKHSNYSSSAIVFVCTCWQKNMYVTVSMQLCLCICVFANLQTGKHAKLIFSVIGFGKHPNSDHDPNFQNPRCPHATNM